jgi:hypothetical protein
MSTPILVGLLMFGGMLLLMALRVPIALWAMWYSAARPAF